MDGAQNTKYKQKTEKMFQKKKKQMECCLFCLDVFF